MSFPTFSSAFVARLAQGFLSRVSALAAKQVPIACIVWLPRQMVTMLFRQSLSQVRQQTPISDHFSMTLIAMV